jgi:SAM-dependent methyltransferase
MCSVTIYDFFIRHVNVEEFSGKMILEVGSRYVNGSVRPLIEKFCKPKEYVGVDFESGKFVDLLLPAEKLLEYFGAERFDVVISTELLEHVQDWRLVINNIKSVLKCGGYVYISTRSKGFPYHGYPYDFWRYEAEDANKIFSDFETAVAEKDENGIFLKARKPENYKPVDLSSLSLYSILLGKRTICIPKIEDMQLKRRFTRRLLSSKGIGILPRALITRLERFFLT